MRINDTSEKFVVQGTREEHLIKLNKHCTDNLQALVRLICENIECINEVIHLINLSKMILYSKDGVELTDNDVYFLRQGDVVYLDLLGRKFNYAQILDQYVKEAQLGLSGTVFKLRDKETSRPSVVKMIKFSAEEKEHAKIDDFIRIQNNILKGLDHRNVIQ